MTKFQKDKYHEARDLPEIKPILAKWIAVQQKYSDQLPDEHSWNYSERASVGFLAAAVWQSGGVALEEWCTEKGAHKDTKRGRCDLFIHRGKHTFNIEAKHLWMAVTGNQLKKINRIERLLDKAVTEAKRLRCSGGERRLAILFVAPFYRPCRHIGIPDQLQTVLKEMYKIGHSAIAWMFAKPNTLKPDPKSNVVQGIVLIIREVSDNMAKLPKKPRLSG